MSESFIMCNSGNNVKPVTGLEFVTSFKTDGLINNTQIVRTATFDAKPDEIYCVTLDDRDREDRGSALYTLNADIIVLQNFHFWSGVLYLYVEVSGSTVTFGFSEGRSATEWVDSSSSGSSFGDRDISVYRLTFD